MSPRKARRVRFGGVLILLFFGFFAFGTAPTAPQQFRKA
jgi:hypothetical protein